MKKTTTNYFKNLREFYCLLEHALPESNTLERKQWASRLIERNFDITVLSKLLFCEKKVATRFLWMLSEVGMLEPQRLLSILPFLLKLYPQIKHLKPESSFANYWLLAGVPTENEAQSIELLFRWIQDPHMNITTKSRSIFVLVNLVKKYPDLKHELTLNLECLLDKHSISFTKKIKKILNQFNA